MFGRARVKKLALIGLATMALAGWVNSSSARDGGPHGFHGGGFHGYDGFHGHGHVGVFIGVPFFWGPPYYPYPPPVYMQQPPPVYIEKAPPVYVEKEPYYWYYCPDPSGYYPHVQSCRKPWLRVVPENSPPQ
jgi:hypothetical protein